MLESLLLDAKRRSWLETATATFEADRDSLASYLVGRGIDRDAAVQHRLGHVSVELPGLERFTGCMSIPYLTPAGVVAMKFRRLDGTEPKYDNPSGQSQRLFNAGVLAQPGLERVVICEGELDAVVCNSVLGVPAVGRPGPAWQRHWPRCFADVDEVLIVADNDKAGMEQAKKVQGTLSRARIITPPDGDLGEWVLEEGREAVLKGMGI